MLVAYQFVFLILYNRICNKGNIQLGGDQYEKALV